MQPVSSTCALFIPDNKELLKGRCCYFKRVGMLCVNLVFVLGNKVTKDILLQCIASGSKR